jgi:CBS domain-containing protein
MDDMFVGRLMSSGVVTVQPDASVQAAAETLREEQIGSLVVADGENRLQGILTSTDFVEIVAENTPKDDSTVSQFMTTDVVTVTAQDSIQDAADKLITNEIHHLPVVDREDHVVGMLSTTDLTAYISAVEEPTPVKA